MMPEKLNSEPIPDESIFLKLHNHIYASEGLTPEDAMEQILNVIYKCVLIIAYKLRM